MSSPDDTQVKRLDECHLKQKEAYNPHSNLIIKHFSGTRESFIMISHNILLPFKLENQRLEGRNGLERAS